MGKRMAFLLLLMLIVLSALPAGARRFDWQQVAYLGRDPFRDPNAGEWYIANPALLNYTQLGFRWEAPRISGLAVDTVRNRLYVATAVGYGYGKLQVWDTSAEPYTKLKEWNTWYKMSGVVPGTTVGGSVTQIVIGGDGAAYAVVNSTFSYNNDSNYGHCILKIYYDAATSSWKREVIWQPESHPNCPSRTSATRYNSIRGICVDMQGNVEWIMDPSGSNLFWNYHHRQKLDVTTGIITCDADGLNVGGGMYMGIYQAIQCIGYDPMMNPVASTNVHFAAGQTLKCYRDIFDGYSVVSPLAEAGLGYAKVTTTSAYDPVNATVWYGFHGDQGCWDPGCGFGTTAIANVVNSNWAGNTDWSLPEFITAHIAPATPDLYNPEDQPWNLDRPYYLASVRKKVWVSAMAPDTTTGDLIYSVVGETTEYNTAPDSPIVRRSAYKGSDVDPVTNPYYGHVLRMNQSCTAIEDEGCPNPNAQVVAIAPLGGGNFLVETLDTDGNRYLYKSVPATPTTMSISQMKTATSGTLIATDGEKIVTWPAACGEANYFYIEEQDRSSGIKVIPRNPADCCAVGQKVAITSGTLQTIRGELVINNAEISVPTSTSDRIEPLGVTQRSLGGARLGSQPPVPTNSSGGANNVGLLVRIVGRIAAVVTDDIRQKAWFTVDDGSSATTSYVDLAGVTQTVPGVKVDFISPYEAGRFVVVTGVSSVDSAPGIYQPTVLPRDGADIIAID